MCKDKAGTGEACKNSGDCCPHHFCDANNVCEMHTKKNNMCKDKAQTGEFCKNNGDCCPHHFCNANSVCEKRSKDAALMDIIDRIGEALQDDE